jgi:hypothetical protein
MEMSSRLKGVVSPLLIPAWPCQISELLRHCPFMRRLHVPIASGHMLTVTRDALREARGGGEGLLEELIEWSDYHKPLKALSIVLSLFPVFPRLAKLHLNMSVPSTAIELDQVLDGFGWVGVGVAAFSM